MNIFSRGQKGKLADLGCPSQFPIVLDMNGPGLTIDVSCFGLDGDDKLSDERFMVFYNQLAAPGNAITLAMDGGKARFNVNLDALPASIAKMVFVAAVDGNGTMRSLGASTMSIGDVVQFPISGGDFQDEKAVIVGEVYRKDGVWRFGANGQGFNGGLSALLKHFGGTEAAAPTPAPAAPAQGKVSLSKVTLEKRGDKVSLDKAAGRGGYGRVHVNLNWNRSGSAPAKTGFFAKLTGGSSTVDLDLACMYEMSDGTRGLVQALGNCWGEYDRYPFIKLEGDDRTGQNANGENILINGDQFNNIKRALIFAFIYKGVPNWTSTDGVVTIDMPGQTPIEVKLDQGGNQMMCAIAMIENRGGSMQVTKLEEYFSQQGSISAHQMMDQRFGFGLRWTTGSKS
ncbi:TerD family protein [Massilia sp. PAMC28688]|uniref:TerD family protein n=1 Tax=Massilia sp. PAMC28688 TaxID=2861283 RepID=UPI001C624B07|nr:TerD family protein [Massilia sp. PAMC28688]QYF94831.1 TerD family protein [Massilia sp. PAMC28688]